jgi:hypothetical protein
VQELDNAIAGDALILTPERVVLSEDLSVQLDLALPVYAPELKSYTTAHSGDLIQHDWQEGEILGSLLENGHIGASKRARFSRAFYGDLFPPMMSFEALLGEKPITHILVNPNNPLSGDMSRSDRFRLMGRTSFGYSLYEVVDPPEP